MVVGIDNDVIRRSYGFMNIRQRKETGREGERVRGIKGEWKGGNVGRE